MGISKILKQISKLFTDTLDIYRDDEVVTEVGDIQIERKLVYSSIPGRGDPWLKDDEPITSKIEEDKAILPILVFTSVEYKIHKGDWIVVNRLDDDGNVLSVYQGKANEPQIYPSHQEILINHKENVQ